MIFPMIDYKYHHLSTEPFHEDGERGNGEGGGDGKGATGRGERGKRWGWGEEGARAGEISQMDMMGCLCGPLNL